MSKYRMNRPVSQQACQKGWQGNRNCSSLSDTLYKRQVAEKMRGHFVQTYMHTYIEMGRRRQTQHSCLYMRYGVKERIWLAVNRIGTYKRPAEASVHTNRIQMDEKVSERNERIIIMRLVFCRRFFSFLYLYFFFLLWWGAESRRH